MCINISGKGDYKPMFENVPIIDDLVIPGVP